MDSQLVNRPWGSYQCLDGGVNDGYQVKRLVIDPHRRLSLQKHYRRSEHWVVTKGDIKCVVGEDLLTLTVNQFLYIPKGVKHKAFVIETQIGEYLGEDDIVRFQDDFGRQ